jgi:hypothetical protein
MVEPNPKVSSALVEESGFIFQGTIKELNSVTMRGVPATEKTIVVEVTKVIRAPDAVGIVPHQVITVMLQKPAKLRRGEEFIFFTNGWLYGESIAVLELGRMKIVKNNILLFDKINDEVDKLPDRRLQNRIDSAILIVVGKVISAKEAESSGPMRLTEHDPQWWKALIEIESVEKGTYKEKTLLIAFPNSMDVVWYKAPKFKVEQEGIWILRKDDIKEVEEAMYTALEPLDFHPKNNLDRIRQLISMSER